MAGQIAKGLDYVKSIPCVPKIAEFVILLIAFCLAGRFLNESPQELFNLVGKKGNIEFFLFTTIVGWLIAIACVVVFVVGIHERISAVPWALVTAIVAGVWTILLLISSALLSTTAKHYDDTIMVSALPSIKKVEYNACKQLGDSNANSQCSQLIGAAIMGFIGAVLYAVDTAIHAYMFQEGRSNKTSKNAPAQKHYLA